MARLKARASGNRSGGGRPRKDGPRTEQDRLKVEPNARVLAERAALGVGDAGARMGPIRYAYSRDWLSAAEMVVAEVYEAAYHQSGLKGPGFSASRDPDWATGAAEQLRIDWTAMDNAQVLALGWNAFSAKEITAIWDSALRPPPANDSGGSAMRKWKALAASVSPAERQEIELVAVQGSWPQWIIQRNAGHMTTTWESRRLLLVSGLRKMGSALQKLRKANDETPGDGGSKAA